jgi:phage terminase small subunit
MTDARPKKMAVTLERHERFCQEYLVDLNATQAAMRTGYSPDSAHAQGCRLLKDADVQLRIKELQAARAVDTAVLRGRVLEELERMALTAPRDSDRAAAIKLLMSHLGMDAPIKTEVSGELGGKTLAELLRLRG